MSGTVAGGLLLGACEPLSNKPWIKATLSTAESLTYRVQRLIMPRTALAAEFPESELSSFFKPNGSSDPQDEDYLALKDNGFSAFKLAVDGLVDRPLSLSLSELRDMPARTQITRHDCVEGWSCIGKWKGVPLGALLNRAGLQSQARFIVFHCADTMEDEEEGVRYYESVDLVDAFHPQTILAYDMNDKVLPVAHGAPLRLRVERQLGYKMAKYVMRVEAVREFSQIGDGRGGYWEDRGYDWYAGI